MEPRITIVTLGVRDLSRAAAFYRDGLGFPVEDASEHIVFFKLQHLTLALYPWDKLAEDATVDHGDQGSPAFRGVTLAHNVETNREVRDILDHAAKTGGRLVKPPETVGWGGYSGYFADPDGHLWEVACPANVETPPS